MEHGKSMFMRVAALGVVLVTLSACTPSDGSNSNGLNPTVGQTGGVAVLTAEDRVEIYELIARYNLTEDTGDIEGWVDTWAPDGRFDVLSRGSSVAGHDELRKFMRDRLRRPGLTNVTHWNGNISITPTPEGAKALSYAMTIEKATDGSLRVRSMATKSDELRKINGQWRFKFRVSTPWRNELPAEWRDTPFGANE